MTILRIRKGGHFKPYYKCETHYLLKFLII